MDLTLWKDKLDAYLDPQEGDMLRLLERIVNMDSFTNDAADENKVGGVVTGWLAGPVYTRQNFRQSTTRLTSSG